MNESFERKILHSADELKQDNPHWCGILQKKNNAGKSQYRYCIIHQGYFYYFETWSSKRPKGVFSLNGYRAIRSTDKKEMIFVIKHPQEGRRDYIFSTGSDRELTEWIEMVNSAVDKFHPVISPFYNPINDNMYVQDYTRQLHRTASITSSISSHSTNSTASNLSDNSFKGCEDIQEVIEDGEDAYEDPDVHRHEFYGHYSVPPNPYSTLGSQNIIDSNVNDNVGYRTIVNKKCDPEEAANTYEEEYYVEMKKECQEQMYERMDDVTKDVQDGMSALNIDGNSELYEDMSQNQNDETYEQMNQHTCNSDFVVGGGHNVQCEELYEQMNAATDATLSNHNAFERDNTIREETDNSEHYIEFNKDLPNDDDTYLKLSCGRPLPSLPNEPRRDVSPLPPLHFQSHDEKPCLPPPRRPSLPPRKEDFQQQANEYDTPRKERPPSVPLRRLSAKPLKPSPPTDGPLVPPRSKEPQILASDADLLPYSVYYPKLEKEVSAGYLQNRTPGTYLIRTERADGNDALAVKCENGDVKHYIIFYKEGEYFLKKNEPTFNTVGNLLRHYMKRTLPTVNQVLTGPVP